MFKKHSWSFAMWLVALLLTGCEPGIGDLEQQVRKARATRGEPVQPLPELTTPEVIAPTIARDPFMDPLAGGRPDHWQIVRQAK